MIVLYVQYIAKMVKNGLEACIFTLKENNYQINNMDYFENFNVLDAVIIEYKLML